MINTFAFWQAVAHTPWWFGLIFIYLFYIGYGATKNHIVPIKIFYLLPIIFFSLSLCAIGTIIKPTFSNAGLWMLMLVPGVLAGWLQFYLFKVKAIQHENKIYIPGTWAVLLLIILMMLLYHYFDYSLSWSLQDLKKGVYSAYFLILYGVGTGMMLGRLFYSRQCLKAGPYVG
ncbi:MAG: hypothetical protein JO149_01185 [Gammaproteobacteria bacterium]|nr:hypothetical protein [Gammaproteobacteria bacterium]